MSVIQQPALQTEGSWVSYPSKYIWVSFRASFTNGRFLSILSQHIYLSVIPGQLYKRKVPEYLIPANIFECHSGPALQTEGSWVSYPSRYIWVSFRASFTNGRLLNILYQHIFLTSQHFMADFWRIRQRFSIIFINNFKKIGNGILLQR